MQPKDFLMMNKEVFQPLERNAHMSCSMHRDVSEEIGYYPFDEKMLTVSKVTPLSSTMGFYVPILSSCQG